MVDLHALATDTSGAWETQVFCGTVVALTDAGTFVSFGALKDGLLPRKWTCRRISPQTRKMVEVELRVNAKIKVMISRIKIGKNLRNSLLVLPFVSPPDARCHCCRAFGHLQSDCMATVYVQVYVQPVDIQIAHSDAHHTSHITACGIT